MLLCILCFSFEKGLILPNLSMLKICNEIIPRSMWMEMTDCNAWNLSIARHAGTNANDKDIAGEQFEFSLAMLQPLTNVWLSWVTVDVHYQDVFSKNCYTPGSLTAHPWNENGAWFTEAFPFGRFSSLFQGAFAVKFWGYILPNTLGTWTIPSTSFRNRSLAYQRRFLKGDFQERHHDQGEIERWWKKFVRLLSNCLYIYMHQSYKLHLFRYIPSWELTYPIQRHFWRWCSFSGGGIWPFLEGI